MNQWADYQSGGTGDAEVYIIEEDRWELFEDQTIGTMEYVPVIYFQGDFYERIQNFE